MMSLAAVHHRPAPDKRPPRSLLSFSSLSPPPLALSLRCASSLDGRGDAARVPGPRVLPTGVDEQARRSLAARGPDVTLSLPSLIAIWGRGPAWLFGRALRACVRSKLCACAPPPPPSGPPRLEPLAIISSLAVDDLCGLLIIPPLPPGRAIHAG